MTVDLSRQKCRLLVYADVSSVCAEGPYCRQLPTYKNNLLKYLFQEIIVLHVNWWTESHSLWFLSVVQKGEVKKRCNNLLLEAHLDETAFNNLNDGNTFETLNAINIFQDSSPSWGTPDSSRWRRLWGRPCPPCGWRRAAAGRSAGPAFHEALHRREDVVLTGTDGAQRDSSRTNAAEWFWQLALPAPAVRTGMASFMGQRGEEGESVRRRSQNSIFRKSLKTSRSVLCPKAKKTDLIFM